MPPLQPISKQFLKAVTLYSWQRKLFSKALEKLQTSSSLLNAPQWQPFSTFKIKVIL